MIAGNDKIRMQHDDSNPKSRISMTRPRMKMMARAARMMRGRSLLPAWFCLMLMVLGVMAPVAQAADVIRGGIMSVGLGGVRGRGGMYRAGSWVPVRVQLENRSGKPFEGYIGVQTHDLDQDRVFSLRPITLTADSVNGQEFWLYYWPQPDDDQGGIRTVVVLDKARNPVATIGLADSTAASAATPAVGVYPRDDKAERSVKVAVVLGPRPVGMGAYIDASGGAEGLRFTWLQNGSDLPDRVLGLDGVDVLIWEADHVRVQDVPADFQMQAVQEWVKAGGHLIISVGTQWRDFGDATTKLGAMLPLKLEGTRDLRVADLAAFPGMTDMRQARGNMAGNAPTFMPQAIGKAADQDRPDVNRVRNIRAQGEFEKNPLVLTWQYGQGAVTLITVDVANPEFDRRVADGNWLVFWDSVAGWPGQTITAVERSRLIKEEEKRPNSEKRNFGGSELELGTKIPVSIDVSDITAVRFLVALVFLAFYWLAAGPIGHLVLRYYKVTHWSWWVFGGVVVMASAVAGIAVTLLQLTTHEIRHQTVVLGTVGSPEVSVVGFYGVFAPSSGIVNVTQPESAGMNYLAPLNVPTLLGIKGFPDQQSYWLSDDHANEAGVIFRHTLKKLEGRWTGSLPGIAGKVAYTGKPGHPLAGKLENQTGYSLHHVEVVLLPANGVIPMSQVYKVSDWKKGAALDMSKAMEAEKVPGTRRELDLRELLRAMGQARAASEGTMGAHLAGVGNPEIQEEKAIAEGRGEDLLYALWDARQPESFASSFRVEVVRHFPRLMDRTKAFRSAGALLIARAGDVDAKDFVKTPVPLKVDGQDVAGKGEVLFLWTLQVSGKAPVQEEDLPGIGGIN